MILWRTFVSDVMKFCRQAFRSIAVRSASVYKYIREVEINLDQNAYIYDKN